MSGMHMQAIGKGVTHLTCRPINLHLYCKNAGNPVESLFEPAFNGVIHIIYFSSS